jgi:hypothetical protein
MITPGDGLLIFWFTVQHPVNKYATIIVDRQYLLAMQ